VSKYWTEFTRIYDLDKIRGLRSVYREFTEWLKEDKGLLSFLDIFGSSPLTSRTNALIAFRSMIEVSLLIRRMTSLVFVPELLLLEYFDEDEFADFRKAYRQLAELAARHEIFGRLDSMLSDVNAPLLAHIEKKAREELIEKLTPFLGDSVASKLSSIPILVDGKDEIEYPASLAIGLLRAESIAVTGNQLVIGPEQVTIVTVAPDQINAEWKRNCSVDLLTPRIMEILRRKKS
jgi:hypothetical protein